jgi:hypothetical protein
MRKRRRNFFLLEGEVQFNPPANCALIEREYKINQNIRKLQKGKGSVLPLREREWGNFYWKARFSITRAPIVYIGIDGGHFREILGRFSVPSR